jgi:hypothetical protein
VAIKLIRASTRSKRRNIMKSVSQQYCECLDLLKANGVTQQQINEAVKNCINEEHHLSTAKKMLKERGIKESVEIRESVRRNNGGRSSSEPIKESRDLANKVNGLARSYGISKAEALLMLSRPTERPHALVTESELKRDWSRYSDILTESEIGTLVKNRVAAPQK